MKRALVFLCLLIVMMTGYSCKKETVSPTAGQRIAARIKSDIAGTTLSDIYVYSYADRSLIFTGTAIEVEDDGTAVVSGSGYYTLNLETLKSYSLGGSGQLYLYF